MQSPAFRITANYSLKGEMVFLFIALFFGLTGFYLSQHNHKKIGISIGLLIVIGLWMLQRRLWLKNFHKGMKHMKARNWINAFNNFQKAYDLFKKYPVLDRYRFPLLISTSAYSFKAMSITNMIFCQFQMKQNDKARFYYEYLLTMPDGHEIAAPFMKWFNKSNEKEL